MQRKEDPELASPAGLVKSASYIQSDRVPKHKVEVIEEDTKSRPLASTDAHPSAHT